MTRNFLPTAVAGLTFLFVKTGHAQWPTKETKPNATVAAGGSGAYKTVREAIDAAPDKGGKRFFIFLKPGTYKEKLIIPSGKAPITLYGQDATTTIITYDDSAGKSDEAGNKLGTSKSYSVRIEPDDFAAEGITFANSHVKTGAEGDQALAVSLAGDRMSFRKCRFTGWQDTIYTDRGREYFEDCFIAGQVDYIFGGATAYFEGCELHCVAKGISITAASTPKDQVFGYVFSHCKITAEEPANWRTNLGRPWKPYAAVAYLNTEMAGVIAPEGWDNWRNPENEKTARFAEYKNTGPGAALEKRVPWAKQLTDAEAGEYTAGNVLKGMDNWNPVSSSK